MPVFLSLPAEILHRIFGFADQESRKALRLTTGSRNILGRADLACLVTKVYLITFDLDNPWEVPQPREDSRLWRVFDRLQELSRLQSVVLRFHPLCNDDDNDWLSHTPQDIALREAMMKRSMAALASHPQLPRELAIHDLQNINQADPTVVADIQRVLGGLQSLRLNITHEHDPGNGENDVDIPNCPIGFDELPSFWLAPTVRNLEQLTLYSSLYFGFYPKLDLRGLHFPRLRRLAFGKYAFVHDSQLDWILSHGATLTELYLDDCPILGEVAVYDPERTYLDPHSFRPQPNLRGKFYASYGGRWKDYFRAFQDGLPCLRRFRYGHGPWWANKMDTTPFETETEMKMGFGRHSYLVYCDGFGPSQYMFSMEYEVQTEDGKSKPVHGGANSTLAGVIGTL